MTDLRVLVCPQPCTLRVGGHTVTVRAAGAYEWLQALGADDFATRIVPGWLDQDGARAVIRAMAVDEVSVEDVVAAAREALAAAAGLPWWKAWRLAQWAVGGYWGELVLRGVDPGRLTLAAWCAAVWALVLEGRDQVGRLKVQTMFDLPPVGEEDASAWTTDLGELGM